jgi:hypothetical protein
MADAQVTDAERKLVEIGVKLGLSEEAALAAVRGCGLTGVNETRIYFKAVVAGKLEGVEDAGAAIRSGRHIGSVVEVDHGKRGEAGLGRVRPTEWGAFSFLKGRTR